MAGVDTGIRQQLEARRYALGDDGRRGRSGVLALHGLVAWDVAADARPQRDGLALLGDAAARESEAACHLQGLAARFERPADAAAIEEFDGDAHRYGESRVGAAVGGAAGNQAE